MAREREVRNDNDQASDPYEVHGNSGGPTSHLAGNGGTTGEGVPEGSGSKTERKIGKRSGTSLCPDRDFGGQASDEVARGKGKKRGDYRRRGVKMDLRPLSR